MAPPCPQLPPLPCARLRSPLPPAPPWPLAPAGFRTYTLGDDNLLPASCNLDHGFKTCTGLNTKVLALEIDASCMVRAYVLGDAGCSNISALGNMTA